ncbi:hypothetical protein KUTeg_016462 [Tegillarca granosa]|uniref:LMBR1 domain-containing protein 2 n=1 Tax=Tegillarca granosa TaxID=220873 RepID=A0ABQ9EKY2_TEGGR|nr:hypothetical protein KUTeg_016462 [Tegillarca granosa]
MSAVPLVLEIICTFCLAAFLIHRYGDVRKQRILSTLPTFVAWYFSFLIIFVLPLDVSSTFYRQCLRDNLVTTPSTTTITTTTARTTDTTNNSILSSPASVHNEKVNNTGSSINLPGSPCEVPLSHVPDNILPALWRVVYWSSQLLTWLVLPLMQSYSTAGDFSIAGKIKTALIENAIYYGTYLLIFGICLIYVAARPDLNIDGVMKYKITLSLKEIKQISEKIKYNHPLRKHVDTILLKCPESMRHSVSRNKDDYEDYDTSRDIPTEKTLVKLHKRVIEKSQAHKRTHAQWNMLKERAFELEDIEANEGNRDRTFKHSFTPTNRGLLSTIYTPQAEWYWKCLIKPWVMRVLAVMLTIFSFMVVWSECLFFVKSPVLSLFAVFLNLAKMNYDYVYIEQFIGDDDDMTQELADEGREMIRRERRKLERKAESEARRRDWNERFGDDSTGGINSSGRANDIETASDLKLNRVQKKYTVPRSPDEKDTTELLKQAEPIDYTGEMNDPLNDFVRSSESAGYQSSQGASAQSSRFGISRPHSRPPPKGIFDDV